MNNSQMRIIQLLPTLAYGDGVGNDTLAIDKILKELHYPTKIYAENIDSRLEKGLAEQADNLPELSEKDVVIYHFSTGSKLNGLLHRIPAKKIMIYHNITPAHFFEPYSDEVVRTCEAGRMELSNLKGSIDYCIADSDYNKQELVEIGYQCKIDTLPILVPFSDYERIPSKKVLKQFKDDWVNIVFVGRVVPNKKQEDIIKTFYYYKNYINRNSRLFLVGSYNVIEEYYDRLDRYVKELQLQDVFFTGHTKFEEILAYYHLADVFISMSEHEGFCIPLLEAMYFKVPIVAYAYTGVKETLAYSGLKLEEKDCKIAAEMIHLLISDSKLRKQVVALQDSRIQDFAYEKIKTEFIRYLKGFLQ